MGNDAMQAHDVRVRVNFGSREIEVEGTGQEVGAWWDRLMPILADLSQRRGESPKAADGPGGELVGSVLNVDSFGEYLHGFPSSITAVDKMLAAAFYIQNQDGDDSFTTGQASRLLSEHGIKLGNPSQCVKMNVDKKHVFAHKGKFRVSRSGIQHLEKLRADAE
jgi:hypothetical protein